MILTELRSSNVGPLKVCEVTLEPRLNIFTGDNGLGKTFLLDAVWWALTGSWAGAPLQPENIRGERSDQPTSIEWSIRGAGGYEVVQQMSANFDQYDQMWTRSVPPTKEPCLIVYARVDSSFSVFDSARNYPPQGPQRIGQPDPDRANLSSELPSFQMSADALFNGLRIGSQVQCKGLLEDWVLWQLKRDTAFEVLKSVLADLSPPGEIIEPDSPERISLYDSREIPTIKTPYGVIPVTRASAGIRRILNMAYVLVWSWKEHKEACAIRKMSPTTEIVLLIDEPESHLHPKWQRSIIPAVLNAAKSLDPSLTAQIISTTHSPLVLASLEPHFQEEQDQLFVFEIPESFNGDRLPEIELSRLEWSLSGTSEGWLTSRVFGLDSGRSLEAEEILQIATNFMTGKEVPEKYNDPQAIENELAKLVPSFDRFWIRWESAKERKHNESQSVQ